MKKKRILCIILATMCVLTSCNAEKSNENEQNKNHLVIALESEPEEGFDPCVGWGRYGSPLIQSTLVTLDADMNIVLDLALNYTISDDGLCWEFDLRDNVKFSDGSELTANDVAFTFETAKNSGSIVDLSVLEAVNVINDEKIEFILTSPQITFIYTIAQTGIVPANLYSESYYKEPVGSGPFTLLQWDQGQQAILGINEYYYGEKPNFEQISILFMNEETAYAAAQKGLVDVAITNANYAMNVIDGMTLQSFETIDNRGITMPVVPDNGEVTEDGYKIGNDITSDISIRQSLSYGIDREKLIEDCLNGYGIPAFSECDGMPWGNDEASVNYDFEYAVSILENAGWVLNADTGIREKNGEIAEFTLLYTSDDSIRQSLSLAVSLEAKKLGISIIVEGTSWDEIDKKMFSNAVLMGWGAQNPLETYLLYHSDNMGVDYYNPEHFSSEITDQYIDMAMGSVDYEQSMEYFKSVQFDGETGVSTYGETPWIWLANIDHLYFVRDGLSLGEQKIHPHGHAWPIVGNLNDWEWLT